MSIRPITPETNCLGVMCERHHRCERYIRVDGQSDYMEPMGHCELDDKGERMHFMPLTQVLL